MEAVLSIEFVDEDKHVVDSYGEDEEGDDLGDDQGDSYAQEREEPDGRGNSDEDDADPEKAEQELGVYREQGGKQGGHVRPLPIRRSARVRRRRRFARLLQVQTYENVRCRVRQRGKEAILAKEERRVDSTAQGEGYVEEHDEVTEYDNLDVCIRALHRGSASSTT